VTKSISEQVTNVEIGKTKGLLSLNCMSKDFKPCNIDVVAYDSLGFVVMEEIDVGSATYIVDFYTTGEFRVEFHNKDVSNG
jgi:hypothetical protein